MNKNTFTTVKLSKGEMNIYDFGSIKLHAYKTNDFIDDEVFILEKNKNAIIIEAPCFFDNIKELTAYLEDLDIKTTGLLLSYHMAGGSFLPGVPVYSTSHADEYGHNGGGAGLIRNFTNTFGDIFDHQIFTVTNTLSEGRVSLGDIDVIITKTSDAFDLEIPEINGVYTHMLGHDCHSIVAGANHADAILSQLDTYVCAGYDLILTSHYTPEDLKDVETKIAYLNNLKSIAEKCNNADSFKSAIQKEYPVYSGKNYLDMTARFFYSL